MKGSDERIYKLTLFSVSLLLLLLLPFLVGAILAFIAGDVFVGLVVILIIYFLLALFRNVIYKIFQGKITVVNALKKNRAIHFNDITSVTFEVAGISVIGGAMLIVSTNEVTKAKLPLTSIYKLIEVLNFLLESGVSPDVFDIKKSTGKGKLIQFENGRFKW